MNADRLLELYDHIADAPDAIARLRQFMLDAAIAGSFIGDCENWIKVPIEKCLEPLEDGKFIHQGWSPRCETFPASTAEKWGVLKTTAIQDGFFLEDENKELPSHLSPKGKLEISAGDILLTCAGPRARCGIACTVPSIRPRLLMSGKMYRFRADRSQILTEYLGLFLRTSMSWAAIDAMKTGSSESGLNLTKDRFRNFEVQFGSLDEQRIILAKVNELTALLDRLEAARVEREATRDRLTTASLARLTAPDTDAEAFPTHACFALATLPALTTRPDQIKPLRQTILNLAVRGKLVEQDPTDEPASELLKRIGKERFARVSKGELRKSKGIAPPSPDAQLFQLPANWEWSVADQLWDFENGDRSSNYPSRDQLVATGIPFVNAGHLVGGRVSLADMNYITSEKFASLGGGKLQRGDQIYCLRGSLGKHAIFDLDCDAAIASSLVILRPVIADCVPYLSLYLDGDIAQTLLRRFDNGSAQPNLSSANLRRYEIPLPPLAEQHRIVAKVDALMALCDRLESTLANADTTRQRLLEALLHEVLTPGEEQEAAA